AADGDGNLWVCDAQRGACSRTTDDGQNDDPIWSADGNSVIFTCGPTIHADLCTQPADGGVITHLVKNRGDWPFPIPYSTSPDARYLLFGTFHLKWNIQLATLGNPVRTIALMTTAYDGS